MWVSRATPGLSQLGSASSTDALVVCVGEDSSSGCAVRPPLAVDVTVDMTIRRGRVDDAQAISALSLRRTAQ